jgi:hypothetical protein
MTPQPHETETSMTEWKSDKRTVDTCIAALPPSFLQNPNVPCGPAVRDAHDNARRALTPAEPIWLSNRLSTLQLAMTQGWSEAKATAWLHETQRLLGDLPSDILSPALDEAVRRKENGFMPSVGEIRAIADPRMADRRRILARLEAVAAMAASGGAEHGSTAADEPVEVCPPDAATAIVEEFGLRNPATERVSRRQVAPRMPTSEDYAALGITIATTTDDEHQRGAGPQQRAG